MRWRLALLVTDDLASVVALYPPCWTRYCLRIFDSRLGVAVCERARRTANICVINGRSFTLIRTSAWAQWLECREGWTCAGTVSIDLVNTFGLVQADQAVILLVNVIHVSLLNGIEGDARIGEGKLP
jgi:hypothetical protein